MRALVTRSELTLTDVTVTHGNEHHAPLDGSCSKPELCPLDSVRPGVSVRIKQLNGSAEVTNRLRELGFCEEQRIKLLMNHTNIICQVCNARLGISSQLAKTIMVEKVPPPGGTRHKEP